jgi:hypothetical protein
VVEGQSCWRLKRRRAEKEDMQRSERKGKKGALKTMQVYHKKIPPPLL